jgi:molybdopterin-guanine dinucleotide biosynthesis protein A
MSILGVVMAGGRNTRFGDLKAFATVGGQRIIDRVIDVLDSVSDEVVMSANDPAAYGSVDLPMRPDIKDGLGALGGIHTALHWAQERGDSAILAVACDMPFPSHTLLREICKRGADYDVVVPESDGRRGVEPLFAYYSVNCLPAIERALERGDQRMIAFHEDVSVLRIPLEDVRRHGDPAIMFMNVNTREDLEEAARISGSAEQ